MKTINILGYQITTESIQLIIQNALNSSDTVVINTLNPHSYVQSKSDETFSNALINSDYLIPDGSGITLAASFLYGFTLKKIAGIDLFYETLQQIEKMKGSVFFLGSSELVLNNIKNKINIEFPNIVVHTLSPPFKAEFSYDDLIQFQNDINNINPDVLFVGLTAPKQEKLIDSIKSEVNPKLISGIGAVFDFYSGNVNRAPKWMIHFHLEWLHRSLISWRLAKRNFISNPKFIYYMLKEKLK